MSARPPRSAARSADLTLAGCALLLFGWLAASSVRHGAGVGAVALLASAAALYAAARLLDWDSGRLVLAGIAAAGLGALLLVPQLRSGTAAAPPLGYGNANGALLAIAVCAAVTLALTSVGWQAQASAGAAVLLVLGTALTRSVAATVLAGVAVLLVLVMQARGARDGRGVAVVALVALVGIVGLTVVLGASYVGPTSAPDWSVRLLSADRLALWRDALRIAQDHPLTGAGPGGFTRLSPTAQDRDLAYSHSYLLGLAADYGWAAAAAGLLLPVTLLVALASRHSGARLAAGAGTVLVLFGQAAMDYTYRFPAVVLPAALVLGLATALPPAEHSRREA